MMNSVSIQIDHGAAGGTVRWPSKKKIFVLPSLHDLNISEQLRKAIERKTEGGR